MAEVKIDGAAITAMLNSTDGPVARKMIVLGEQVKAKTVASLKAGFVRDFLGPRIVKRFVPGPGGIGVQVGADKVRTQPHDIRGNPKLAFNWPPPNGPGGLVVFASVHHPGSDFSAYLQRQLDKARDSMKGQI